MAPTNSLEIAKLGDFYTCDRRRFSVTSARYRSMCKLCNMTASKQALEEKSKALIEAMEQYCGSRFTAARQRAQVRGDAWALYTTRRQVYEEGTLTLDEWLNICHQYGGRCAYCAQEAHLTIDHIQPVSKGGKHEAGNVRPACLPCNARKKDGVLDLHVSFLRV